MQLKLMHVIVFGSTFDCMWLRTSCLTNVTSVVVSTRIAKDRIIIALSTED